MPDPTAASVVGVGTASLSPVAFRGALWGDPSADVDAFGGRAAIAAISLVVAIVLSFLVHREGRAACRVSPSWASVALLWSTDLPARSTDTFPIEAGAIGALPFGIVGRSAWGE